MSNVSKYEFLQGAINTEDGNKKIQDTLITIKEKLEEAETQVFVSPASCIEHCGAACEALAQLYMLKRLPDDLNRMKKENKGYFPTTDTIWKSNEYINAFIRQWYDESARQKKKNRDDLILYQTLFILKGEYNCVKHNGTREYSYPLIGGSDFKYRKEDTEKIRPLTKKVKPTDNEYRKKILTHKNALQRLEDTYSYLSAVLLKCEVMGKDEIPPYTEPERMRLVSDDTLERLISDKQNDKEPPKSEELVSNRLLEDDININETYKKLKESSKESFIDSVVHLKYFDNSDIDLSSLGIRKEWLPKIRSRQESYINLSAFIKDGIRNGLNNYVVYAETGMGKTYSIFDAINEVLSEDIVYGNKPVIPLFISSLILSINHLGIVDYINNTIVGDTVKTTNNLMKDEAGVHFLLFIDAINESYNSDEILDEIIDLSMHKSVSLIVSSNNSDDSKTLQNSGFYELQLEQLDLGVIEEEVEGENVSGQLKNLLCKPFYLKQFLSQTNIGNIKDEYSVIDAYIQNCKTNRKIVTARESGKWNSLLDEELPLICYECVKNSKMHISLRDDIGDEYILLKDDQNVTKLVQAGIIKKYAGAVYFEHEIYRNFFAAKYLLNMCSDLCNNPNAPQPLKTELLNLFVTLLQETPSYVCSLLAPKLYNEKLLFKLFEEYRLLVNDQLFFRVIVYLFSLISKTLDGLDFSNADLWMTDFSQFDSIINCNFRGANLNPETIWLQHSKINYTRDNRGRIRDDLIFLAGPEGFEVYNWKDDRQLFISLCEIGIPNEWVVSEEALIFQCSENIYIVSLDEIDNRLYANTAEIKEELILTDEYADNSISFDKHHNQEITKNTRGDELSIINNKLYIKLSGKATMNELNDTCCFASFIDDDHIFADCDGVYMIMTNEGVLSWKRMIKPILPTLLAEEQNYAYIEMLLPGASRSKFFKYDYSKHQLSLAKEEDLKLIEKQLDEKGHGQFLGGVAKSSISILDNNGEKHVIFGGAIDFDNSVFEKTTIVSREMEEIEKQILSQFGGIVLE